MPNFKLVAILFFALSLHLLAQTPRKEGTASVSGRVLLNGGPASGVSVGLQPRQQSGGPFVADRSKYLRVKTDNEGRFRFTGVLAGQYFIVALAPGFISAGGSSMPMAKMLNIADGENVESVELQIKRGAVITGRITDPSGSPIVEKQVRLMKQDQRGSFTPYNLGDVSEPSLTDDRGVYRIHSLPAGRYKVSFGYAPQDGGFYEMSRLYYPRTFYPDATDESQAKVIELSDGTEAPDVDIKLSTVKKNYEFAGRVIEAETGKPVAGIQIGYGTQSGGNSSAISGASVTDAQGEYQLQGVQPGKYLAFADSRMESEGSEYYSEQTPFEISDADVADVEIRVHRGSSISGIAIVEGSNDPAILSQLTKIYLGLTYRQGDRMAGRNVRPAANGSFRFSGLKPGKAEIQAYTEPDGLKLLRIEHNGTPVTDGLEIQPGENQSNFRVVFGYGTAVLRGQVKFVGGALPEGGAIYLRSKLIRNVGSGSFSIPVDARGQFVIKNLLAGEYELQLVISFPGPISPELTKLLISLRKRSHRVTVSSGETQTEFVVDLSQKEDDK